MKRLQERPDLPGHGQPVEDYTIPFLVVAGVLCWIVLVVIWAVSGLIGALLSGFAADRMIPQAHSTPGKKR